MLSRCAIKVDATSRLETESVDGVVYHTFRVWAEGKGQLELTIVITDLNYMFNTRKGYIKLPPYTQLRFTYAMHDLSPRCYWLE